MAQFCGGSFLMLYVFWIPPFFLRFYLAYNNSISYDFICNCHIGVIDFLHVLVEISPAMPQPLLDLPHFIMMIEFSPYIWVTVTVISTACYML
jgi:hypothetical protein